MADDAIFATLGAGNGIARLGQAPLRSKPKAIVPVPADAPQCTWRHPKHGTPVAMWPYRDADGRLVGYVARVDYDGADGRRAKDVLPIAYCRFGQGSDQAHAWRACALPAPRPLYRLPELVADPTASVVVTEGEKKADAVRALFPGWLGTTSMGGARAATRSDWSPLTGRTVIIWPDNDKPGQRYANDVAALATAAGAVSVAIVNVPEDWPVKWDLADPLPDGANSETLTELLRRATLWIPPTEIPPAETVSPDDDAEIVRLAKLSSIAYEREREPTARRLGLRTSILDRLVQAARNDAVAVPGQGRPLDLPEPELWPQPVDGAELLDETVAAIQQYVILPRRHAESTALWTIFTHAFNAFDFSPRLVISSAEMRSGKTRLVEVIQRIVPKPLLASGITAAALLRVIDQHAPCMLLDEIDTMMKGDAELREALRGLINSGFDRPGARFIKNVPMPGGGYEPQAFSTWCPMLLAGIGKLPDTVVDRSIPIELERKPSDQKVKPLRASDGDELRIIGRKIARWVADNLSALRDARPEPPTQIHDRAADTWSPLFSIADRAGGAWPERARRAAIELSAEGEDAMSAGVLLLADLHELFASRPSGVLFTREILTALHADETRPWPEWKNGRPITERQLAALLKPYKVKPRTVRRGIETEKGYRLDWFMAPFASYLQARSVTASQSSIPAAFGSDLSVTQSDPATRYVTDNRNRKLSVSATCDGVTSPEARSDHGEFEERAAILEFDGGCTRSEAERLARIETISGDKPPPL